MYSVLQTVLLTWCSLLFYLINYCYLFGYRTFRNYSLHSVPLPLNDLSVGIKHGGEEFMNQYKKVQNIPPINVDCDEWICVFGAESSWLVYNGCYFTFSNLSHIIPYRYIGPFNRRMTANDVIPTFKWRIIPGVIMCFCNYFSWFSRLKRS